MIVDRYYYQCLNDREKAVYQIVYAGIRDHKELIPVGAFTLGEKSFDRVFHAVVADNPLLYYCNHSVMNIAQDQFGNNAFCPQYFYTEDQVRKYNQKIQETVNRLIAELRLTEGSDYEKVLKLNDYFCKNVKYDHEGKDLNDVARVIMSHNILGVFAKKRAQCEGIAKAAKVLLNAVDVKCIVAEGVAKMEDGTQSLHAWNVVKEDGEPYHVDITFNIGQTTNGNVAYDWLNVTDSMIKGNHTIDPDVMLPICSADRLNYYKVNKAVFSIKSFACEYVRKKIRQGERLIYMRFSGRIKVANIYGDLIKVAGEVINEYGSEEEQKLSINSALGVETNTLRLWIH